MMSRGTQNLAGRLGYLKLEKGPCNLSCVRDHHRLSMQIILITSVVACSVQSRKRQLKWDMTDNVRLSKMNVFAQAAARPNQQQQAKAFIDWPFDRVKPFGPVVTPGHLVSSMTSSQHANVGGPALPLSRRELFLLCF